VTPAEEILGHTERLYCPWLECSLVHSFSPDCKARCAKEIKL
jgi:hypothetical protein